MKRTSLWTLLFVLGASSLATAGSFKPEKIDADAKWVIHVDMEALRATEGGKLCREKCLARKEVQRHLDKVREEIGMDPSKDLLSATIYDTQFEKEHGVAMIHVRKVDGERLLAKLNEKEPDNRMMQYKKHQLYLWTKRHRGKEMTVCGTLHKDQVLIFSRDPLKVIAALDVLDGTTPGLNKKSQLAGKVQPGTVLLVRAAGLADSDMKAKCPILEESSWMEVAVGAAKGKSFLRAVVDTESKETAANTKGVLEGFVALVRLRYSDQEAVTKMLKGLEVGVSGAKLTVEWTADEKEVLETLEKVHAQMKGHPGKWHKHFQSHGDKKAHH